MRSPNWMLCSVCGVGDAESHVLEPTFAGPQTVYTCGTALCEACKLEPVEQLDIDRAMGCRTCRVHLRLRMRREAIDAEIEGAP